MELYILDSLYRRIEVIDKYESVIWTERWQAYGDFELVLRSSYYYRAALIEGTFLACSESDRIMQVLEVEDKITGDGEEVLTIRGFSAEEVLAQRVCKESMFGTATWYITASPIGIPRTLFTHIMETDEFGNPPALNTGDPVPLLSQRFPAVDITHESFVETTVDWSQEEPDTLYNEIRKVCKRYDLGFRIVRDPNGGALYFEVYTGRDVTTRQEVHSPVIFSLPFENLRNATEFRSSQKFKNVGYIFGDGVAEVLFVDGYDFTTVGFERRVLFLNRSIPSDWTAPPGGFLETIGWEALRDHRRVAIFEGEIDPENEYKYNEDYFLGDLVEVRNRDGVVSYKHITEQIFVSDQAGFRSFPTLSVGRFDPPNTWSEMGDDTWEDMWTEYWEDM